MGCLDYCYYIIETPLHPGETSVIETRTLHRKAYQIVLNEIELIRKDIDGDADGWLPGLRRFFRPQSESDVSKLRNRLERALKPLHDEWMTQYPILHIGPDQTKFRVELQDPKQSMSGYFGMYYKPKTDTERAEIKAELNVMLNRGMFEAACKADHNFSTKSFSHSVARCFVHEQIHLAQASKVSQSVAEERPNKKKLFMTWVQRDAVLLAHINGMADQDRQALIYIAKEAEIEAYADNAASQSLFVLYGSKDNPLEHILSILDDPKQMEELGKKVPGSLGRYMGAYKAFPEQFAPAYESFMRQYVEKLRHYGEGYG